jgi:hypothetical protein
MAALHTAQPSSAQLSSAELSPAHLTKVEDGHAHPVHPLIARVVGRVHVVRHVQLAITVGVQQGAVNGPGGVGAGDGKLAGGCGSGRRGA